MATELQKELMKEALKTEVGKRAFRKVFCSNLFEVILPYAFPIGRIAKLSMAGAAVTNSTNPIVVGKNITMTVIECCVPVPASVRLAANCATATVLLATSALTRDPIMAGTFVHAVTDIFKDQDC